jgi:hypothetical protein
MTDRIWFYKPNLYWHGWRTFVPVFFGTDEFERHTVVLGWTVTGRVVIARKNPCPGGCWMWVDTDEDVS